MKNDYIQINGESFRIEFNWNAISNFLEANDLPFTAIDELNKLKPTQITSFCFEAVKEGTEIDKKEFPYNVKQFGAAIGLPQVVDLLTVYKSQIAAKNHGNKKKRRAF